MQKLTLGQYFPGDSIVHRLDPRTKFISLLLLIIGITAVDSSYRLLGLCGAVIALSAATKVPVRVFTRQLRPFVILLAITFLLHAFMGAGEPVLTVPGIGISITDGGIRFGFFYSLRLLLLIALSLIFMFTTSPVDVTDGFEKLMRPLRRFRFPADSAALMLGIAFRFIPVLFEEAERIRKAQIARGARLSGSIRARVRGVVSIVIPLFISVFRRADALSLSLEARGFTPGGDRTYYNELKFGIADYTALAAVLVISAGAAAF